MDTIRNFFNTNFPNFENEIDSNFLLEGWINLQKSIEGFSGTDAAIASAPVVLLAAGVTIFLGVAGESFFKRTGIPDIAFLMILGVIIGPVLGIIQPEVVVEVVPYFAALALIIIMFDGGLNLDLRHMVKTAHFTIFLAIFSFIISVAIVAMLSHYGLGWEWLDSVLLGAIVGGSSSIIVFNLVRNFRVSEETRSMLSFESAITDILATIIAFILSHWRNIWTCSSGWAYSRFWCWNPLDVCYNKT
jgi:cell volume regulation protein A